MDDVMDENDTSPTWWRRRSWQYAAASFLLGVLYVVQLSQLRPLRWLKEGVEKVSEGDLSTRVPVVRMDEIGQVGRAFNQMTGRLEQMLDDHDRLMADVSHELRSPLARMKVALELMPEGSKRDQIASDIREMEALTAALLERERVKGRAAQLQKSDFDVVALSRAVIESFDNAEPGIELTDSPGTVMINADEALVRILLQNLVDNAVKFSLADSAAVTVSLEPSASLIRITISDDGAGIPEELAERVLEPFVKLDPSRGHRNVYGLGLNLCQRVVDAHSGKIDIRQREPRGTRVVVSLPVLSDQAESGSQ